MRLKDIFEVSGNPELNQQYKEIYNNLKEKYEKVNQYGRKYIPTIELIGDYECSSGYARKTYRGKLPDGVELTELELSMICDNGFSHFGGSSSISKDGTYTVVIYTD